MSKIFISYRRQESGDIVGRIFDHLSNVFTKHNIFKDVDNIGAGENFRNVITDAIKNSQVLLLIIGREWIKVKGPNGIRRIDDPNDYVRIEIETAIENKIRIIPILIGDTNLPSPDKFPLQIRNITNFNAVKIRNDPDFKKDINHLVSELRKVVRT